MSAYDPVQSFAVTIGNGRFLGLAVAQYAACNAQELQLKLF